jgi:hypothetical protein
MFMSTAGLATKNECAVEDQQQFTRKLDIHYTAYKRPLVTVRHPPSHNAGATTALIFTRSTKSMYKHTWHVTLYIYKIIY